MFARAARLAARTARRSGGARAAAYATAAAAATAAGTLMVGLRAPSVAAAAAAAASDADKPVPLEESPDFVPPVPVMNAKEFVAAEVTATYDHTRDSKLVTLAVSPEGGEFPTCSFVLLRATIDGKEVVRPYTPVYADSKGGIVLAIKEYDEGKLSKLVCNLEAGATVDVKGPLPKMEYKANMVKDFVMIAGGSGITPMYQIINKVWENPEDETAVTLLYANRSPNHVMLGHLMETLFHYRPNSTLVHVLDEGAPTELPHVHQGRISRELLEKYLPAPSADAKVAVCGPPPMVAAICGPKAKDYSQGEVSGLLKDLGWDESNVYKF